MHNIKYEPPNNDPLMQKLHGDFYSFRDNIYNLMETICNHTIAQNYRKYFSSIDMQSLKLWGGLPLVVSENPYQHCNMRELLSALHSQLTLLETFYANVIYDDVIYGQEVCEDQADFFLSLFETHYPFKPSFDDLLDDFSDWMDAHLNRF